MKYSEKLYTERMIQVGLNISHYRKIRGLTQLELAEKANISRTLISKIEAKDMVKSFSFKVLFKIAAALDVEPSMLLEYKDLDKK